MNIFVTDRCPVQSARNLPDKHIVKMPLETCQMLSIIYSDWYYGVGKLYKQDGTPYRTSHGAFRNHPCTQWAAANQNNLAWLILHGVALCDEYYQRYGKVHTCYDVICQAQRIWYNCFDYEIVGDLSQASRKVVDFTRAMPESIKFDTTIDTITAYKQYLNTKPWLATNYLRIPSRKPSFITTMTQTPIKTDLPVYDFSTTPEQRAQEQANIDKAIANAKKSMKDAPVVAKMKANKLVAPKKAPAKAKGSKSGRVVGISADENVFLKQLLLDIANNTQYNKDEAYNKLIARYNIKN